jgi:alpha-amylase/alpha-mannosidase (GH57 family)
MSDRYICIHCHFYQPPRENPWLEAVELQDSAYPFHDWNERITAECYAPNAASRILSAQGKIADITNNYSNISYNFGPTLLSWMEECAPQTYERIIEADKESQRRFSGHGSAIAQVYNHMILPLANRRDKQTQVLWGIRDFEHRFGRFPEGMWLAEAAVDTETLEILAENGIKFTILAPNQARAARKIHPNAKWKSVEGGKIDPAKAYLCNLPSGKSITLFFYDGPISQAVAFEKLLSSGENFAQRLVGGFNDTRKWPQIMHIATDGETYGHHHAHGDMALAYALHYIESNNLAKITNYGEYLEKHPANTEVQIVERTSWSCAHGVERWKANCGCNSGMKPAWNQNWREPLRGALDWLRDAISVPFEQRARELMKDPWAARDEYVRVVLDRSTFNVHRFLAAHAAYPLSAQQRITALQLLEMQRHAMLMYTSCGWFFDELTGIETVQVIFYAGRAIQLAKEVLGQDLETEFLERLARAKSNVPALSDGAAIYRKWVKPAIVDLVGVAAHYAISSMFEAYADENSIYCYDVDVLNHHEQMAGRARMAVGRARITSRITCDSEEVTFGAVHFGDHNLSAGVRKFQGDQAYKDVERDVSEAFSRADLPGALMSLHRHFGDAVYSLKSLFRDEQRKIVDEIMNSVLADARMAYGHLYELHAPLMRFLTDIHMPLPPILGVTAELTVNNDLHRLLSTDQIDADRLRTILDAAKREQVALDAAGLSYVLRKRVQTVADEFVEKPEDPDMLNQVEALVEAVRLLPFEVDLWRLQNAFYDVLRRNSFETKGSEWIDRFKELGAQLGLALNFDRYQQTVAA